MKYLLTISLCFLALSLSSQETITYPYNPDGDVDGAIASPDLLDLLGVYSNAFTPTEIQIDGVGLLEVIQDLQNQIASIQLIDVNYVESTLAALQQEIDNLNQQIAENSLPDGTASGQLLRWNGTAWILVSPILEGCGDPSACNYNPGYIGDNGSCFVIDECGVCGGDNSCYDQCGVPNGDNSTCLDECGVPNGDNSTCLDECGVPNGDGSSCVFESCGDQIGHLNYAYSTVLIGDQCWFSENCRYLPEVSPSSEGSDTNPYYYVYGYEGSDVAEAQATSNYDTYGVLYNWPAVMDVYSTTWSICPSGWHIPSDEEFTQLIDFLGGEGVAGGKMKEAGDDHWYTQSTGATNSSGWTGLPGGARWFENSSFVNKGSEGSWWSASQVEVQGQDYDRWASSRWLNHGDDMVEYMARWQSYGCSARCIKD